MPCYTVQTTSVDLGNVDHKLLMLAMAELKLNPRQQGDTIYFQNGVYSISTKQLDLRGANAEERAAEMKRAYSGEVVKATARKYNWQVKKTAANKYQVLKRSF